MSIFTLHMVLSQFVWSLSSLHLILLILLRAKANAYSHFTSTRILWVNAWGVGVWHSLCPVPSSVGKWYGLLQLHRAEKWTNCDKQFHARYGAALSTPTRSMAPVCVTSTILSFGLTFLYQRTTQKTRWHYCVIKTFRFAIVTKIKRFHEPTMTSKIEMLVAELFRSTFRSSVCTAPHWQCDTFAYIQIVDVVFRLQSIHRSNFSMHSVHTFKCSLRKPANLIFVRS